MATRKGTTSRKPKASKVSLSTVIAQASEASGKDATVMGKQVRRDLRAHLDDYVKRFKYDLNGKDNRDGNRWPDMPRALARELVKRHS